MTLEPIKVASAENRLSVRRGAIAGVFVAVAVAGLFFAFVPILGGTADPPGEVENPKLAALFNEQFDQVIEEMQPPHLAGFMPGAKANARAYLISIEAVTTYRRQRRSARPNQPPTTYMTVRYSNGKEFTPELGVDRAAIIAATGVRLRLENGRVVSAQTDGAERDYPIDQVRHYVNKTVWELLAIDMQQNPQFYYWPQPPASPPADNRKAWAS